VQVVAVQGNRVRLGISAPSDVGVWREEVVAMPQWEGEGRREPVGCSSGTRCLPKKG
jgi:sRNA-binding carbon storage regulator CsrA